MGQNLSRLFRGRQRQFEIDNDLCLKQIVDILITDPELILNWRKLFDGLDLKAQNCVQLERQVKNSTIEGYELFYTILNKWISAEGNNATIYELQQVLEDNGFRAVAEKLSNIQSSKKNTVNLKIWFEIGRATNNFVGRREELEELKEYFNSQKAPYVVTISGMGGVGKSELVKNFAKEIAENQCVDCVWLNGESKESLKNSITRLESFLHLPNPDKDEPSKTVDLLFARAISTIKGNSRMLVIIDNVDEANEDVQKIISKMQDGRCYFVITSRNVLVLRTAGSQIQLNILSDEAAIDLLKKSDINEPDDELKKLCSLLGNFPLALHQAAAYIKQQKLIAIKGESYKISDYMDIYQSQKRCLLGHKLNQIENDYRETTLITWDISLKKIQQDEESGQIAIELLNTIAYFEPDGIHVDFLNLYQPDLLKAIPLVKTYSLVKFENGMISIHRLIQQVIRLNLSSDQLEISQLTKIITAIQPILEPAKRWVGLTSYLYPDEYEKSWVDEERSLKHIKNGMGHIVSVLKHAAQHSQLLANFKNVFLECLNNLRYFASHQQIIDLCHATLDQTKCVGSKAEFTLRVESELTYAQCRLDRKFNQSNLLKLKNVYTEQWSIFGEEGKSTLTTAHYIAKVQFEYWYKMSAKDNAKNVQWCRNVVQLKTKVFGPLHKSTLSTKVILAHQRYYDKNYHEALKLYEELFQWQITHLGAEGSGTYFIFRLYVKSLLNTDNVEKARCVVVQHLQQELTQSIHEVYEDLSLVLFCLGKIEEAVATLRRAINIKNIDDKISIFDSNLSKYNDANILLKNKNNSAALKIYRSFREFNYFCYWWKADVNYKIAQCLIGLHDLKQAQTALENAFIILSINAGDNCKPVIDMKKSLDDINILIGASKDFSDSEWTDSDSSDLDDEDV